MKFYPDSFTDEEFDSYFKSGQVLMMFLDDENMSDGNLTTIIEDPNERFKAANKYAIEHNAQVYTEIDLDSGECGYSKGFRFVNRINHGLYTVVKVEGLEVDNS